MSADCHCQIMFTETETVFFFFLPKFGSLMTKCYSISVCSSSDVVIGGASVNVIVLLIPYFDKMKTNKQTHKSSIKPF